MTLQARNKTGSNSSSLQESDESIPDGWKKTTLGSVITFQRGHDLPSTERREGKIPVIGANGIAAYHDEAKMKGPGLAIGRSGTLGKVYYVEGDYWPLNTCLYVKEYRSVNPKFIFYFLHMIDFEKYNAGSTVPTMNRNFLHPIRVIIPRDIEEQQKIASILSKVDHLIQKTEEITKQTQRLKRGLMQQLLTRGINHTRFKEVLFYHKRLQIPEEWEVIRLKDHTSKIGSGITPLGGSQVYKKQGIPFIRSQNVHFDRLYLEDVVYISKEVHDEMGNTKLQSFDVLLNITGASIGRCNYVPPNFGEGNVNQHVCIIRATQRLNPIFLAKFLSIPLMQNLINTKQAGLSRQGLTFREIGNLYILCPSMGEQQEIIKIISNIDTKLNRESNYKNLVIKLKQGLMRKLLTGKIRVKV